MLDEPELSTAMESNKHSGVFAVIMFFSVLASSPFCSVFAKDVGSRQGDSDLEVSNGSTGITKDGVLRLDPGPLIDVIRQIDELVPSMIARSKDSALAENWRMPNLAYIGGSESLMVSTHLTLRDVTPLQAVAIAVRAADCFVEPIVFDFDEQQHESYPFLSYAVFPMKAEPCSGCLMPRSSAGTEGSESARQGMHGEASLGLKFVEWGSINAAASVDEVDQSDAESVRIFSIRGAYNQAGIQIPESKNREKLVGEIMGLISAAMEISDPGGRVAEVYYHEGSGSLISKGAEEQHDIVRQAIGSIWIDHD